MQNKYHELSPVFIIGTPRSGTTLLYRTLLQHSSFKPKNLCLEEAKIFLQPFLAILSSQRPAALYNYLLEDESVYQQYVKSISFEIFWQKLSRKIRLYLFMTEDVYWTLNLNAKVIRKYFIFAKQARRCNRIVEKTPQHLLNTKRIFKSFPQSKIIVTVRHPVEVFSSYKKRKKVDKKSKWLDISIDDFIQRHSNMSDFAINLFEKDKALCIKYEDFTRNPEDPFTKICNYLEEPYESEPVMKAEPKLDHWKMDPYLSKPITQNTKKWSDYLDVDQVKIIELMLKNEMHKFEYTSKLTS